MDPIVQSLFDRKSVRAFTGEPVTDQEKALLFEAAFQAPTAGCQQLYTIIDVTDQAEKEELSELCDHQPFIARAPVVLIFCADCQKWLEAYRAAGLDPRSPGMGDALLAMADAVIAAQNVVVAAQALGLGSCYIGDILEHCERVRPLLALPEHVFPAAMLVIGRPTQQQKDRPKPERFPGEYTVCRNKFADWSRMGTEGFRDMFAGHTGPAGFEAWIGAFCARKYESGFSREMSRSAQEWLRPFQTDGGEGQSRQNDEK